MEVRIISFLKVYSLLVSFSRPASCRFSSPASHSVRGLPCVLGFQASCVLWCKGTDYFVNHKIFRPLFFVTRIIFSGLPHRHSHHGQKVLPRPSTIPLSSHWGWKTIVLWHPYPDTEACSRQRHGDCSCLR